MLTKNSLLIANTGKPFGREDVIGLCHMNLGSKQNNKWFIYQVMKA